MEKEPKSDLPGPGEYSKETPIELRLRRAPTFGVSRRPLSSIEQMRVPGPGTYNPVEDVHGPAFSLRSRWRTENIGRDSPGPAEYSPVRGDEFGGLWKRQSSM